MIIISPTILSKLLIIKLSIMRIVAYLSTIAIAFISIACNAQQVITGIWYGERDASLVCVTLDTNGCFSITSESNSNFNISGRYTIEESSNIITLTETLNGIAAKGIFNLETDGTLKMNLNFGLPGMVEIPKSFNSESPSPSSVYLALTRDRDAIESIIYPTIEIPSEATIAFLRNRRLGVGINLNAVVDGNKHPGYERDAPLSDAEIASIANIGFNSIRLNVCWAKHASIKPPYTINPEFFAKVDHIVDESLKNGLAVSIDQHYYPYINMESGDNRISVEDNYERLISLWEQIGEHYKNYSNETLFFDLLNEPNMQMGAERWNKLLNQLIKTIRKSNPNRTLLIATPNLGQHWTINSLELPSDDWNLIVEFHYYLPHMFTHQGLSYASAGNSTEVTWNATMQEIDPILSDLEYCKRWSERNGRPLNMGEYGVVNTVDKESRARWIGFIARAAAERDISTHIWGYREPFMIRDEKSGEWLWDILEAMGL